MSYKTYPFRPWCMFILSNVICYSQKYVGNLKILYCSSQTPPLDYICNVKNFSYKTLSDRLHLNSHSSENTYAVKLKLSKVL